MSDLSGAEGFERLLRRTTPVERPLGTAEGPLVFLGVEQPSAWRFPFDPCLVADYRGA
jgi:hypothetical protein